MSKTIPFGFMPAEVVTQEESHAWVKVELDKETGNLEIVEPSEEDVKHADKRYIEKLADLGHIDEEEAQEFL